jgi:aspartate/methionine/tyrosine aminotransferase
MTHRHNTDYYNTGTQEVVSFHTVSKGAYGECGMRGGYMEMHNFDPAVIDQMYKIAAINLCSNMPGQVAIGMMLNPPKPGQPSYPLYRREKQGIIDSQQRRARMISDAFNSLEGVTCQETDGAMYVFCSIFFLSFLICVMMSLSLSPIYCCLLALSDTT